MSFSEIKKCPACGGKGEYPYLNSQQEEIIIECPTCEGTGYAKRRLLLGGKKHQCIERPIEYEDIDL